MDRRIAMIVALFVILFVEGYAPARAELIFGPVTAVPAPINDINGNIWPTLAPDMLTMYFASSRPGSSGPTDIWMSTRASAASSWNTPMVLSSAVNSNLAETAPSISVDGRELYFRRAGSPGEGIGNRGDIYVSKRTSTGDPWGPAEKLPAPINLDQFDENEPNISFDGRELYFNSTRPTDGGQDIYVTRRASSSGPFGAPELFLKSAGSPFLSADRLKFFFVTPELLPTLGHDDFYVMTRPTASAPFGPPMHLASISSTREDFGLILSADGSTVYFSSDRFGEPRGGPFGEYGMWQASVIPEPTSLSAIFSWMLCAYVYLGRRRRAYGSG
jgi:hypothetical protein